MAFWRGVIERNFPFSIYLKNTHTDQRGGQIHDHEIDCAEAEQKLSKNDLSHLKASLTQGRGGGGERDGHWSS